MMKSKKFTRRIVAAFIMATMVTSAFAGCGLTTDKGPVVDAGKTQLEIGNMDRGLGDEWLNAVIDKFETAYANYAGENGKVGVEVIVTNKKDEFATGNLAVNMPYNEMDLYIVANSEYSTLYMKKFEGQSILADLTDLVKAKNYDKDGNLVADGTGTTSIADRMISDYKNYYDLSEDGSGTYYGLPFFATCSGGIYDADYFDEYELYFLPDGTIGANQNDINDGNCGKGPDGILGTYDDGMPATWEQFKELMTAIVQADGTPFIWDGLNTYERSYFFQQLYANYEGANDFGLLYSFNGTDSEFGEITEANAYKLAGQEGRLAANQAISDIMSNALYYSADAMKSSTTHTNAQRLYLKSIEEGKRIAMFMEGSWWENEARDVFNEMELTEESWGHGKRNFKMLPIPNFEGTTLPTAGNGTKVSTQKDNKQVMVMNDAGGSAIYVSNQAPHKDLAMEFVKFMHSREMLALMTQMSSCIRPFEYKLTDAEYAACTKYTKSIIDMMSDENTDIVWGKASRTSIWGKYTSTFSEKWTGEEVFTAYFGGALPYTLYSATKAHFESNWPVKA